MSAFTGTGKLVRLALRRDRVQLPVWLLSVTATVAATAASVQSLYDGERDRLAYATTSAASVVARAFNGPISGTSLGAVAMAESFFLLAILVPLMSTFAVVRHTRQNEETGRAEMIGSAVVGRYAGLTAALVVAVGANAVLALLVAGALVGTGLPGLGSLAVGAGVGAAGAAFAGIAAIAAQLPETARGANGLAVAALGLAFLLRALGDAMGEVTGGGVRVVSGWPSWLSPLGWMSQVRPYEGNRWWVLALPAATLVVTVAAAFALTTRRDIGAGMIPARRGPAAAAPGLLSPLGLAWRLQRGVLAAWAVGLVVLGVPFGAVADEVEGVVAGNDQAAQLIAQLGGTENLVDAFFGLMMGLFGLAVAGYAVQALLRMRAEEAGGPLEPVLATAVGRLRFLASHLGVAAAGVVALLLLAGVSNGLGYGLAAGGPGEKIATVTGAALVHAPAALVLAGFVVAVFGLLPRWTVPLTWTALVVCLFMSQLGALLELPQAVLNVSPFTHTPAVPADDVTVLPLVSLLAVAVALTAAGAAAFRRRDLSF